MKIFLLTAVFLCSLHKGEAQNIYVAPHAVVSFYSAAPIEDIKGTSHQAVSALNLATKTLYFKVSIQSFQFPKSLMQEHFNEDYLQSDQYPFSEFIGKLSDSSGILRKGPHRVRITGKLTIHHVTRSCSIEGTMQAQNGTITGHSVFSVKLADYHIRVPRLLLKNIAETVQITVDARYKPVSPVKKS